MLEVLVVDDDPGQLRIREMVLRNAGLAVQAAGSVESALALLRADGDKTGVVVTDHFLADRTGVELVREVRATRPLMPVVVVSGMPGIEDEYEGLNVSVRQKPFPPEELIREVRRILGSPAR
jgi:two-component system OmpR family response regulator